jgi:hypothetical protein
MRVSRARFLAAATLVLISLQASGAPALAASPAAVPCTSPAAFRAVSGVTSSDLWAVGNCWTGSQPQGLIEHWNGRRWRISATSGHVVMFTGIAAVTASDAWAVGGSAIVHWNGRRWARSPAPTAGDSLQAISAISAADIWAVGSAGNTSSQHTVTVHWNGRHWRRVPSPDPATGTGSSNSLAGVAGSSARNVWAVGFDAPSGVGYRSLILHWNGRAWKQVPSPDPAAASSTELTAVTVAGSDAWAVGTAIVGDNVSLVLSWNGRGWHRVPSPNPGGGRGSYFNGIAAASRTSVWATGAYGVGLLGATRTFIAHWNSQTWRQVRSPDPGSQGSDNLLFAAAITSGSAWSVGCYTTGSGNCGTLVQRQTRTGWTDVRSGPRP